MTRCTLPVLVAALVLGIACGKDNNPTGPSSTTPPPTQTPPPNNPSPPAAQVTLIGVVSRTIGGPAPGVTVRVSGAGNSRETTTDGNGYYSFGGITVGAITLALSGTGYASRSETITLSGDLQHNTTIEYVPPFSRSGTGNTVFDMPTRPMRVRITGTYTRNSSNFVIRVGGRLVINELLGTGWGTTRYEGIHQVSGGVVEITISSGVAWTIDEVR